MRYPIVTVLAAAVVMLVGCTQPSGEPSTPAGSPTPSPAQPYAPPTVVPASPTPKPTITPRFFEVTGDFETADFSTPSGRIWCGIGAQHAGCMLDYIDQDALPKLNDCGDMGSTQPPNVIVLDEAAKAPEFACYNDAFSSPERNMNGDAEWTKAIGGWTKVKLGDRTVDVAVLPYGEGLRAGTMACTSEEFGVTCVNTKTGHGFLVRNRGVVKF